MNKAIIYFEANEQCLTRTGTECFASDTISYIEADFNLGENWSGFDSVRAVWSNGWETVSTVLDSDGKTIVPTEVLTRRAKVRVNLVGSIASGNELTDRLTTFPIDALDITKKALIDGSETAPITPSQFEQFVANVKADADRAEDARDDAEGIKTEVEGLKSDVVQLKTDTEAIKTEVRDLAEGFDDTVAQAKGEITELTAQSKSGISSLATTERNSISTLAGDKKAEIVQEATTQKSAVTSEGTRQVGLVSAEGQTQVQNVTDEGTTQVNAVRTEGGTQITNIEQKGADVLSRIPYFAPIITDTAEGSIASFTDGADDYPMKSVVAQINPIQAGSGDPSPSNVRPISGWSGVNVYNTGINIWDEQTELGLLNADGSVTPNSQRLTTKNYISVKEGVEYCMSAPSSAQRGRGAYYDESFNLVDYMSDFPASVTIIGNRQYGMFTPPSGAKYLKVCLTVNYGMTYNHDISINYPSTDTSYHPYQGTSYSIPFKDSEDNPITVYGGEIDVVSGLLKSYPFYPSYNGETLSGEWICDRAVYSQGTTPPIGSQVVDMSGNGTEYNLEPTEVKSLLGNNNVWCDTGDTSVEYPADTKLYIDKKINAMI